MHYRLYRLNETTGKIVDGADILAENDREAIQAGRDVCTDAPFEIWCKSRRVYSPTRTALPAEPASDVA